MCSNTYSFYLALIEKRFVRLSPSTIFAQFMRGTIPTWKRAQVSLAFAVFTGFASNDW